MTVRQHRPRSAVSGQGALTRTITRVAAFAALSAVVAIASCSSDVPEVLDNQPGASSGQPGGCAVGAEGCPCGEPGKVVDCGQIMHEAGSYVTCSMGRSTCVGGRWGACTGDRIVTKSVGVALDGAGIRPLARAIPCENPCNPNECNAHEGGPDDVTDSEFTVQDGGGIGLNPDGGGGPQCEGLQCEVDECGGNPEETTISGQVLDPAGNNPLYGIQVYIPVDPTGALPAFTPGASRSVCSGAGTITAVAETKTDANGMFTLRGVPSGTGLPAGTGIPLVLQSGKWRREIMLSNITPCQNNRVGAQSGQTGCKAPTPAEACTLRLPRNRRDGWDWATSTYSRADMPKIALVSGGADPFECLLVKIGIDPDEFGSTTKNADRTVHFFESPALAATRLAPAYGNHVDGTDLYGSATKSSILPNYDVVVLACEASAAAKTTHAYENLLQYANNGGRVFATHYSYVWLKGRSAWNNNVATWLSSTRVTQDPLPAVLDTSFARGAAFADWLLNVGASTTQGRIDLHEARQDLTFSGPYARPWMTATNTTASSNKSFEPLFTFETPYPTSSAPVTPYGRVVFSDFHVSADAISTGATTCIADSDCGYGQTCLGVSAAFPGSCNEKCNTASDCGNTAYTCSGAVTAGTCAKKACSSWWNTCSTGSCRSGVCACTNNSHCGSGSTCNTSTGTCSPKACTQDSECGSDGFCDVVVTTPGQCGKTCNKNSDCSAGKELCIRTPSTATSASFTQPAASSTVVVPVASAAQIAAGQTFYVDGGGKYTVVSVSGSNVTVRNLGGSNAAPGTVLPAGSSVKVECNGGSCSGQCTGCLSGSQCTSKVATPVCSGASAGYGTCSPAAPSGTGFNPKTSDRGPWGWFPYACAQSAMLGQEKALEFMFFDLTSCVEGSAPTHPPATYAEASFTQDFTATCRPDQRPVWRELDWRAEVPSGTSIEFAAQSGPDAAGLLPATPVRLATTTSSTPAGSWDVALIDTSDGMTPAGTGPFNTASPPVKSDSLLRVTFTLRPTTDQLSTPVLTSWKVEYDCMSAE